MSELSVIDTPLAGLKIIQRPAIKDDRGFFSRFFCQASLSSAGFNKHISQINHTYTAKKGAVRGLHFQYPPHAEIKMVSCLKGEVFDVAVDLRSNSKTFLQWHGEMLSAENQRSLLIPEGFAHGFQTLSNDCELIYLHSVPYVKSAESALNVQDPALAIDWPLNITELSMRDSNHAFLDQNFVGINK